MCSDRHNAYEGRGTRARITLSDAVEQQSVLLARLLHASLNCIDVEGSCVGVDIRADSVGGTWDFCWQTQPMDALRFNVAESIWNLHSQPPLFNLYGAFLGRLFYPDHLQYMHYSNMVLGSLLSGMMWFIALEFSGSRPLAFVTALALPLNPALFLYEACPLYTLPAAFLLVLTLFCLALFSLGKRWGPRYLLILMPIISLLATLMLDATLKISKAGWRYAGRALFVLLFILGTYRNTYLGTVSLRDDYHARVLPALNLVREHQNEMVVVGSSVDQSRARSGF